MNRQHTGLASCPWCDWTYEASGPTKEAVIDALSKAIDAHNIAANHVIKKGVRPKEGLYRGDPIQ